MANDSPQNDTPQNLPYIPIGVDGVVEVRGHLVGSSLIDGLRRIFATDSQMEQGDYHMDRSVDLLYRHLQLMALKDQNAIRHRFLKAQGLKQDLYSDDYNGSSFQKFWEARQYKRLSRKAYKIIKLASDRIRENSLINQLAEATQPHGGQPRSGPGGSGPGGSDSGGSGSGGSGPGGSDSGGSGPEGSDSGGSGPGGSDPGGSGPGGSGPGGPGGSGPGIASRPGNGSGNPFTDSHAVSTLTDVSVNDLDRVEMSTYHEETTNEAAFVLDLVGQDKSVQHIVATFPTKAFSGDRTDREASQSIASASAAISLHRDDGSSPRIIPVPLPLADVSDERADEKGEDIHLISAQCAQHSGIDSELTSRLAETSTLSSFAPSELATLEGNRSHPVPLASVRPTEDPYTRTFVPRRPL